MGTPFIDQARQTLLSESLAQLATQRSILFLEVKNIRKMKRELAMRSSQVQGQTFTPSDGLAVFQDDRGVQAVTCCCRGSLGRSSNP